MAFNDLAANQMVAYNQASSGGFTLKSGQTNPNTLQMMTKDMAFAMYNLSPTTGSNDILGNQLMQKSFWLVASNIQYQGNLIVGNSGGTFKEWGYQRSTTGTLLYGSLTPYLGVAPLKNGNIAGIKWYSNAFSFTVSGVPESTPPIDWATILVDGNGYNRTAMMMSYDAGAGWWTFIISTPSNILGTTDGRNLTVQFLGANAVADSTAPSAPTSLSTNTILSNQLNLLWTASTDAVGVTNYLIYRNGSLIDTIGNTTNYTVYGLTPSTAYNFTVYARDAAGNISAVSNTATATTTRATDVPPSTPSNIVISNITSNALTISWTASTDDYGISQYHIFANSSTTALVVINSTQSTGTVTYNVTGLSPSTSYYFRIFARDIDGNFSAPGQSATINTAAAPAGPATPTGLYANTFSDTEISTGWNATAGATGYVLYRSTRANGIYDVVIDTTSINYMDNFLTPGITYYYQVLAYSGANYSARSSAVFATTYGGGGGGGLEIA